VLQASEGGSISVGNRKFKIRQSVTPRPLLTPPPSASPEGVPVAMPTNLRTDRISRRSRISPLRLSTLSPATDKMVVSKSALVGFCLTSFAGGIAMTLAVDRMHARAAEAPREPEPIVLKTTPAETAPAAAMVAPPPAVAPAPAPAAPVAASPAAAEAVVVQLPPPPPVHDEKVKPTKAAAPVATSVAHVAHKIVAAPLIPPPAPAGKVAAAAPARPVAPRKQPRAAESNPTEAAPDEDPVLPTATKKKWSDPFAQ
jgi:hypothetical protein